MSDGPAQAVECVVIGAGVIGLAVARALALRGLEVFVLEREAQFGQHTSSRNSEVIHAGIYYPENSLKARFCVEGKALLAEYCDAHAVPYRRLGKLLVATQEAQRAQLESIAQQARKNGVHDLRYLTPAEAQAMEPLVTCVAALFSPSSGIIDSHALMQALEADLLRAGGHVLYHAQVNGGGIEADGIRLTVAGAASYAIRARRVVNCGGLFAPDFVRGLAGFPEAHRVPQYFARGNYFGLARNPGFTHLVYPMPEPGGLGIHVTLDLEGHVRFGPDVEWIEAIDYAQDDSRAARFADSIRRYWPGIDAQALRPAYTGIRPKLSKTAAGDFLFQGPGAHGVDGLLNLYGIESPGLTSCLAIARHACDMICK